MPNPRRSPCRSAPPHGRGRGRSRLAWLLGLALLAALVAAGGWWWKPRSGAAPAAAPAPPAGAGQGAGGGRGAGAPGRFAGGQTQPVSVGVVRREDVRVMVSAIGTMNARATAVVRAKVSGELKALRFKEGEEVKAGQLLAEIDPRSYQAALQQVQGNLQRDQALLNNARIDLRRYQELKAQDSIAGQQVDTQAALVRQYEGVVAADQAQVDAARLQLEYTRVTAPIAGRLGLRQADLGNVVNPSDTNGIVTVTQVRPIDAAFSVPEAHLAQIREHLAQGDPLPVELWDREQKKRLGRGRLGALDNAIDTTTGTIKVKAAFANEEGHLYPNQFVNVKLQVQLLRQALTVPATAVQNNYVYLVQADGTVMQRRIRVGPVDGERVSVEGELSEGDQVVTDGIDRLREGAKVVVIDSEAASKADQSAQEAGQRRAAFLKNLTPEQRDKLAKMSPDERRAFIRTLRGAGGASDAAARAAAPHGATPGGPGTPGAPGASAAPGGAAAAAPASAPRSEAAR